MGKEGELEQHDLPSEADLEELEPVAPINDKARAKRAKAARKRRLTAKLKRADLDEEALEKLHRVVDEQDAPPAPTADPTEAMDPEARAQLAFLSNLKSGDLAELLWKSIDAVFLQGGRYELNEKKRKVLIDATTPLLDKWLPSVANTPEAGFVVAVAVVFGPPAVAHLMEPKNVPKAAELPPAAEKAAA